MDIYVDAFSYSYQSQGGVSRIYDELLPRMCNYEKDIHINMFQSNQLFRQLPQHQNITETIYPSVEKYMRPWRLWKPIIPHIQDLYIRVNIGATKNKIYHSTYYTTLPFWKGPKVVMVYDMIHEKFPELKGNSAKIIPKKIKSIQNADKLICISHSTQSDLVEIYNIDPAKTVVIYPGHDQEVFKIMKDLNENVAKPYLLYVGRRAGYKNFSVLLSAYSRWEHRDTINLYVVGDDWNDGEWQRISELQLNQNIVLIKNVGDYKLARLYNQAMAYINTSRYEGFGLPIIEAMGCGCPIIASDIPTTREIARSIPYYFSVDEPGSLLNAMNKSLNGRNDSERVEFGFKVASTFSWDSMAKATLNVYHELIL